MRAAFVTAMTAATTVALVLVTVVALAASCAAAMAPGVAVGGWSWVVSLAEVGDFRGRLQKSRLRSSRALP